MLGRKPGKKLLQVWLTADQHRRLKHEAQEMGRKLGSHVRFRLFDAKAIVENTLKDVLLEIVEKVDGLMEKQGQTAREVLDLDNLRKQIRKL